MEAEFKDFTNGKPAAQEERVIAGTAHYLQHLRIPRNTACPSRACRDFLGECPGQKGALWHIYKTDTFGSKTHLSEKRGIW